MTDSKTTIRDIRQAIAEFRKIRHWDKEDPKDIAIGLSLEANEVLDIFQWRAWEEVLAHPHALEAIGDELADVMFYLGMMANRLDIDLSEAFDRKLKKSGDKYPAEVLRDAGSPEEKRRIYYRLKAKARGGHPLAEED